jgi:8-oxo-dGTP pyrophosphatase MutT (NUDIX family)
MADEQPLVETPTDVGIALPRPHEAAQREIAQAGAICFRKKAKQPLEVLLIGSRRNGRWGIPKGHIEPGETTRETATREAFEEAGIRGKVAKKIVGSFTYTKDSGVLTYRVEVHMLAVVEVLRDFPEKGIRRTQWVSIDVAAREVAQPGLRQILQGLS